MKNTRSSWWTRTAARLVCTALVAAALPALAQVATAGPAAAATTPAPTDFRKLEQQVAYETNQVRLHPQALAEILRNAPRTGPDNYTLPSGTVGSGTAPYNAAAAAEAMTQPALPALAWSETVANDARAYVYAQNRYGRLSVGHGPDNATEPGFPFRPGERFGPEGITDADPRDAKGYVYQFWISRNEWSIGSPWDPNKSFLGGAFQRGHRGIVNDQRYNAIGVGCGAEIPMFGATQVACIVQFGNNMPDASPVATPESGSPSLAALPTSVAGSIGTTPAPGQTTLSVDTQAPPTPITTATALPTDTMATPTSGPGAPAAIGTSTATASASAGEVCAPNGGQRTGDLQFGQKWDPQANGCLLISVTPLQTFTPSGKATITGTRTTSYRNYQVTYEISGSRKYNLPDIGDVSCETPDGSDLVIDPEIKEGLPTPGTFGSATARFKIGCGSGPDGYARVVIKGGKALGGGMATWVQSTASPSAPASLSAPVAPSGPVAQAVCPGADQSGLTGTAAASVLRCLFDQARKAAGLPATTTNDQADYYAGLATTDGAIQINPSNVCSGKPPAGGWKQGIVHASTPQQAFDSAGGLDNGFFKSTNYTYLGLAQGNGNNYGLFAATC